MKRSILARVVLAALLFLVLGGPASGHIGSCSDSADGPADPEQFCREKNTWVCARQRQADPDLLGCAGAPRFTQAQYDACIAAIPSLCAGEGPPDCLITTRQTERCLDALRNADNICIPLNMITECTFCT